MRRVAPYVLLAAAVFAAHGPGLAGELVLARDDRALLDRALLFWPDRAFALDAHASHVVSLLVFALSVFAVQAFLRRLGLGPAGALAGAALVAVHPLTVEVTAWVAARGDALALGFAAASLAVGLRARYALGAAAVGAAALFVLAVLTSPGVLALPAFLFCARLWRADRKWPDALGPVLPSAFMALGAGAMAIGVWSATEAARLSASLSERAALVGLTSWHHAKALVVPLHLSIAYGAPEAARWNAQAFAGVAVLVLLAVVAVRRARAEWRLGAVWTLAALAPISNALPLGDFATDRTLVLALVGSAIVLGAAVDAGVRSKDRRLHLVAATAAAVVVMLGAPLSRARAREFESAETVYRAALWHDPRSARARRELEEAADREVARDEGTD